MTAYGTLNYSVRALQLPLAIIVLGTDGYAIHQFHGYIINEEFPFGNFDSYYGVPGAWSFLLFCACWTVLVASVHLAAGYRFSNAAKEFANRSWLGYLLVTVEAMTMLSWLGGFIAVTVQVTTDASASCGKDRNTCGVLVAAAAVGACEWLLFVASAALTTMLIFKRCRRP